MQFPDGQGLVDLGACTLSFTGVMADPAANSGKRVFLLEEFQGFVIPAVAHQSDKALYADMGRTGGLAGGGSPFADAECAWNSLWVLLENGFSKIEFFVVLVGAGDGADLRALAAAGAFGEVYIAGRLVNFGGKVSRLALDAQKLSVREEFNV